MSSHHVIRDEQEPPLIILDDTFDLEIVNQLLGWSPLLIVEASLLKYFNARQIKVDAIIHLKGDEGLTEAGSEPITAYYFDTYDSQLLQSITFILKGKDFTGMNIVCGLKTRDLLLTELNLFVHLSYPINLFVSNEKTIIAFRPVVKKWYPAEQELSFNAEHIKCERSLKNLGARFKVTEAGSHIFRTSGKFIAITEY